MPPQELIFATGLGQEAPPAEDDRPTIVDQAPPTARPDRRRTIVLLVCVTAILGFYVRCSWTDGKQLDPAPDRLDFQNRQTDAILAGQLNLRVDVPPELLALPDPQDPIANAPYRSQGAPRPLVVRRAGLRATSGSRRVLLLYLPFRLLDVGDLSPTLAGLIFCSLGFLASVGSFRLVSRRFLRPLTLGGEALGVCALGLAAPIGWLVSIGRAYEVAIACGYFLVSAGILALAAGLLRPVRRRDAYVALGSALLAGSVAARPSLAWTLVLLLLIPAYLRWVEKVRVRWTTWCAMLAPVVAIGLALAWYNWARFGSPTEFGTTYMLLGENVRLARADELGFLGKGLFEYLLSPAVRTDDSHGSRSARCRSRYRPSRTTSPNRSPACFRTCRRRVRHRCGVLPAVARLRSQRWLTLFIALLTGIGLVIVASVSFHFHGATMRYQMDYAPLLLLASVLGWTMFSQQFDRRAPLARVLQTGAVARRDVVGGLLGRYHLVPMRRNRELLRWSSPQAMRRFEFEPTPAVRASRARGAFTPCPVCASDSERYLFHKLGVRFVRCRSCGLVYANPPAAAGRRYFDVDAVGQHHATRPRSSSSTTSSTIIRTGCRRSSEPHRGRPAEEIVLAGRTLSDGPDDGAGRDRCHRRPPRRRRRRSGHHARRRQPDHPPDRRRNERARAERAARGLRRHRRS